MQTADERFKHILSCNPRLERIIAKFKPEQTWQTREELVIEYLTDNVQPSMALYNVLWFFMDNVSPSLLGVETEQWEEVTCQPQLESLPDLD